MNKIIKQIGNTAVILDQATGAIEETIALQDFSYEFSNGQAQFIDSNKTKTVYTVALANLFDEGGAPLSDEDTALAYLSQFVAPAGTVSLDPGAQVEIIDNAGNPMAISNNFGSEVTKGFIIMGEDENGFMHRVRTTQDGRLISTASVANPPGSVPVVQTAQGNVTTTVDDDFIIPNGETIILQQLSAGAEGDVDGSKVELFYFPDGTKTGGTLISVLYVNGSNGADNLVASFTGDGSALITMRRSRLAGSAREIFGKWQGYKYI